MKRWRVNKPDERLAAEFGRKCDLSPLTLKVMVSRGYTEFQDIADFFSDAALSDPFMIKDMQIAADVITELWTATSLYAFTGITTATVSPQQLFYIIILKIWAQT